MSTSVNSSARTWPLRLSALALFVLGVVPMANVVAPGRGLEWWVPSVRLWTLWTVLLGLVALVLARVAQSAVDELPSNFASVVLRPSRRVFMAIVGTATCLLAVFFAWHLFRFEPVTIDELSMQWQAGLLASGRLFARAEPHGEFFSTMQTVTVGDRWFTHFPIGAPALLSAGMAVGLPWLVNPLLAGVAAIVLYRFLAAATTELEARAVALLFALSPFVLFMAASQLDHLGALLAVWTAVAALPSWIRSETATHARRAAAIVGIALGAAAAIRPYDAALCAIAIAAFQLHAARGAPVLARSLLVQIAAGAIPVALLLGANWATTGHPTNFAYDVLNGAAHRPGFHIDPFGVAHTPRRGVYNVSAYLLRLDGSLLGWPVPALALVVAALVLQRRATKWDRLLLAVLGMLLVGYWAYWGEGRSLGPRFLFTAAPVFLLYVSRFPALVRERVHSTTWRRVATLLVPLWMLAGWLLPAAVAQPSGVWALARRAQDRSTATRLIERSVEARRLSNALVLVNDGWHARLSARLRALGARPFAAQSIVGHYDACMLQQLLDSAEQVTSDPAARSRVVFGELDRAPAATPVPGLPAMEQLALQPGRPVDVQCQRELAAARSNGVDLARLLPRVAIDAHGRLSGEVVYARDLGTRDTMLAARFGDRLWYTARVERVGGALRATLEPLAH